VAVDVWKKKSNTLTHGWVEKLDTAENVRWVKKMGGIWKTGVPLETEFRVKEEG